MKKICTVAPSSPHDPDLYAQSAQQAKNFDFDIISHASIYDHMPGYINGSTHERLESMSQALKIKPDALWCTRGGVGALELWPYLLNHEISKSNIPIIGYSDNTILHMARWVAGKKTSIHGPVFLDFAGKKNTNLNLITKILDNQINNINYPPLKLCNQINFKNNSGYLICMNLTSLQSLSNIFTKNNFSSIFLALEDTNEPEYKIFRKITQIKLSGLLDNILGLIIGQFGHKKQNIMREIFIPLGHELNIPVFDWPIFGHEEENWPLIFGANINLNASNNYLYNLSYQQILGV